VIRLTIALAAALLGAAPAMGFHATDIAGLGYARDFDLVDQTGAPRTMADYRGKVVVVTFGYTHCPDLCPTTLSDLAAAGQALGGTAAPRVQVLFVTVDPERDTPALLSSYVRAFDPDFVGLTGTAEAIARTAREFHVFFEKIPDSGADSYAMDHSGGAFVFDAGGAVRLFIPPGARPADISDDLGELLPR
jgi:protein SCO1/2